MRVALALATTLAVGALVTVTAHAADVPIKPRMTVATVPLHSANPAGKPEEDLQPEKTQAQKLLGLDNLSLADELKKPPTDNAPEPVLAPSGAQTGLLVPLFRGGDMPISEEQNRGSFFDRHEFGIQLRSPF